MPVARRVLLVVGLLVQAAFMGSPAQAAERHFDCSKPGNATKAACKTAAPKPAAAKPVHSTTTTTTTKTTTRQYDCTKAGNANKSACKVAASKAATKTTPGAVKTTATTSSTTSDCSKWYNKAWAACRTTTATPVAKTTVAPAPKPGTAAPAQVPATARAGAANDPNGATARCKDGTYSHAAHRTGACSRHGGVANWI